MSNESLTIIDGPSAESLDQANRARTARIARERADLVEIPVEQHERVSFSVLIAGGQRVHVELELFSVNPTSCCGPNYKIMGHTPERVRLLPDHKTIVIPMYDSHLKTGIMEFH